MRRAGWAFSSVAEFEGTATAVAVILAPERVTVAEKGELKITLLDALAEHGVVILNAACCQLLDAAGVGVLVSVNATAQRVGRRLIVAGLTPPVAELFALCRLGELLEVTDTLGEALRRVAGSEGTAGAQPAGAGA